MTINRKKIYEKYNGHCAYCGDHIEFKRMQVDHYWPQQLAHFYPELDNNRDENLMPSCQPCNIHKHGMRPEEWRNELQKQISMLLKNAQFKRVLKYNQIKLTKSPIIFYFEKIKTEKIKSLHSIIKSKKKIIIDEINFDGMKYTDDLINDALKIRKKPNDHKHIR